MRLLFALALGLALLAGCASQPVQPAPSVVPVPAPAQEPVSLPASISIPSIEAQSSLIPLGLNPDETIEVPSIETPEQAGFYRYGPLPGAVGPAVVLGHVDGDGRPGIFHRLRELRPGAQVNVLLTDGSTLTFTVTRTQRVDKDEFPTDAVYGDVDSPELRLITCGGAFDRGSGHYEDNLIVFAEL